MTKKNSNKGPTPIHYLAFEGGGGKGVAYVGAIEALEKKKVIKYVNDHSDRGRRLDNSAIMGISGTSAGAITAVLLAAGYNSTRLRTFIERTNANAFFDDPNPGSCPTLRYRKQLRGGQSKIRFDMIIPTDNAIVGNATLLSKKDSAKRKLVGGIVVAFEAWRNSKLLKEQEKQTFLERKLWDNALEYMDCLSLDLGLFSGEQLRFELDKVLAKQTGSYGITFEQFFTASGGIHLKLAGVCTSTSEVIWFDHIGPWRDMAVVDAVRISMSIPFVFKPIAVPTLTLQKDVPPGTVDLGRSLLFVDGGILNNTPIHAFDDPNSSKVVNRCAGELFGGNPERSDKTLPLNKHVLGIRLTAPGEKEPIYSGSLPGMLGQVLNTMLAPAEEAQIRSAEEASQTLDLSTEGLDTLEFSPKPPLMDAAINAAKKKTIEFLKKRENDGLGLRDVP